LYIGYYKQALIIILKLTSLEGKVQVKLQELFFKLIIVTIKVIRGSNLNTTGVASIIIVIASRAAKGSI
jgi:hypothetical protein